MSTVNMPSVETLAARLTASWRRTDQIFDLVPRDMILARPIELRLPLIFYVGHLPAFAWNHLCRAVVGRRSFNPTFDEIFERGIDPDVDDPTKCHAHPDIPEVWPALADVVAYRDRVRDELIRALDVLDAAATTHVMARSARVASMVIEHELMHQETLLYLLQQLPPDAKRRPAPRSPVRRRGVRPHAVFIEPGDATLGAEFDALDFGWDNEFPTERVPVPGFRIDATPVTNGEFLAFVESGGYERAALWQDDWDWKTREALRHPLCWVERDGARWYRTMFELVPLPDAADWPVSVSLAEARAYARWSGARLPTEAEYHRAAYGEPGGRERRFPWGDAPPGREHGNFDFVEWSPGAVGSHPAGASAFGVHDLVGHGWELTDTAFAPFPGFTAYIPTYPGYSADFFDGKHFVLKGASWATDQALVRRSFRNWYQARYPYVFSKFRCVRPARG
jgi:ergothioneine biosynthesis protein EgtB